MNLYEWPTPNPTPKPTHHWGVDKSYKIVWVRSYEFIQISHLEKYVRIGCEIVLVLDTFLAFLLIHSLSTQYVLN